MGDCGAGRLSAAWRCKRADGRRGGRRGGPGCHLRTPPQAILACVEHWCISGIWSTLCGTCREPYMSATPPASSTSNSPATPLALHQPTHQPFQQRLRQPTYQPLHQPTRQQQTAALHLHGLTQARALRDIHICTAVDLQLRCWISTRKDLSLWSTAHAFLSHHPCPCSGSNPP